MLRKYLRGPKGRLGICFGGFHFSGSMPISSSGQIFSVDLCNAKYASHIYKVTVAGDMLGNIVWICPLARGTTADVLICFVLSQTHHHSLWAVQGEVLR